MKKLQRYDLEKCYFYGEYNKTIDYGKRNAHLEGVNDHIAQLNNERRQYEQEIRKVIDAEKDNENRKYNFWRKWRKIKFVSLGTFIGSIILGIIIDSALHGMPEMLLSLLVYLILMITPILFLIAAFIQVISRKSYSRYADKLGERLHSISRNFEDKAKTCYLAIDDIYLNSLEPAHREMVLMRREQNEHNRKLEETAEERRRLEWENLEESRRLRHTQEQLLAIEQEREKRRLRW